MNNNTGNFEGALSWDSPITAENSFVVLPAGEYDFKVDKMTRGQYNPSQNSKIRESAPKAELEITIFGNGETTTTTENLILHSKTEWKLSEFFIAIGQKKPGEPLNPNWQFVPGATGRAKVEINKYTNKEGVERENNRIAEFLPPVANQGPVGGYQPPTQSAQPVYQAPPMAQPAQPIQQGTTQQGAATPPPANNGFSF